MPNQKKRTAWSVQDVVSGRAAKGGNPKFKSGYTGPKKPRSDYDLDNDSGGTYRKSGNGARYVDDKASRRPSAGARGGSGFVAMSGYGIMDYAWVAYLLILATSLIVALSVYSAKAHKIEGYVYPSYIFSMNGLLNSIYCDYDNGGLGTAYNQDVISNAGNQDVDKDSILGGTSNNSALPNTTTGATMTLDTGSTYGEFGIAGSHEELLTQLDKALAANDFGFVGMKLAYRDETTGDLIGYPPSVVETFTKYMSDNSDKRENFIKEINDPAEYSARNEIAYIVVLPILKFTINMGYDNTIISMSGFSDIEMSAGQSATVSPILPCMYTITVTTNGASQSQEFEADMNEGNLQVNIGVTN